MKILKTINEKLEISICMFLICFMTILIFIQVFMRYVMQSSLSWSEELARYVFIWLIYIGVSHGAQTMRYIKIEAAMGLFPKKVRPYITIVGDVLFLLFALFIFIIGFHLSFRIMQMGQSSPALRMPMWMVYAAPAVGYGLTVFRQIQVIIYRIKNREEL